MAQPLQFKSHECGIEGMVHWSSLIILGFTFGPLLFSIGLLFFLPTILGDPASRFADDVKMAFLRSQSSRLLSSLSSAWAWVGKWGLPINPNMCSCWGPPSPFSVFFDTKHRILQATDVRDVDASFTSSVHCTVNSIELCHSAATPEECNGSQRPKTEMTARPKLSSMKEQCVFSVCREILE